jgi:hypothetical protein
MNQKQLTVLVVVGLLLGGLALVVNQSRQKDFDRRDAGVGEKLLQDFPTADVAGVTLKSHEGEVNLTKGEVWTVKERAGYPAAFSEIADLVRKLWELKAVQSQKVGPSQWGRLGLALPDAKDAGTNAATVIELKGKDGKPLRTVYLGKKQMRDSGGQFGGYPVGRWIAVPTDKETVFLASETFNEAEPKVETWLSKDFLKVEKVKSIALVSTNAAGSWSVSRTNETADWVLADAKEGENPDKSKMSGFNWALSSPSFTDVHPKDAEPVKNAFANPTVVKLSTFEGFSYEVKVGSQPDPESFFITVAASAELPKERTAPADEKPEDKEKADKAWKEAQEKLTEKLKKEQALGNWVYKVAKWTVDSVIKERSGLMADKKADAAAGGDAGIGAPPIPGLGGEAPAPVPLTLPQ